jgi:hypothetical protein
MLMAVPVEMKGQAFKAGLPVFLFDGPSSGDSRNYHVSPDGSRFVMVEPDSETTADHFNVVFNWFEELRRLVPTN